MVESVLFPVGAGFVWGLAVSLFNNFWTYRALKNPSGSMGVIFFVLRQVFNLLAMYAVYRNVAMLIGTALGLLAVKNYILIKNTTVLFQQRKKRKG